MMLNPLLLENISANGFYESEWGMRRERSWTAIPI